MVIEMVLAIEVAVVFVVKVISWWYCNPVLNAALGRRLVVLLVGYERKWSTNPRSHPGLPLLCPPLPLLPLLPW